MYLGSSYPKFYIYETASDEEIDASPISLQNFVINRKHETLINENSYTHINPLTKKKIKISDGYWWKEFLTISSKNFRGTVVELNDMEVTEATQSELNKITNLLQYINNPAYYVKYVPHEDAERLLSFVPFECNITVTAQDTRGNVTRLGSDSFIMNVDTITIMIESKDIVSAPFLPQPSSAPEWVAPADLAVTGYSVDFEWTEVTGYTDYTLQISTSAGFESIYLVYNDMVSGVEETVSSLTGETYYARVRVGETGLWSDTLTFYPFAFNKCLEFKSNESDYLRSNAVDNTMNSRTKVQCGCWVYLKSGSTQTYQYAITSASTSGLSSTIAFFIRFQYVTDHYELTVRVQETSIPAVNVTRQYTTAFPTNTWCFVAFNYDTSLSGDERFKMILNDEFVGSLTTGAGGFPDETNASGLKYFIVGNYLDVSTGSEFIGYIDHIFLNVYPHAQADFMTEAELLECYNGGVGRNYPAAMYRWLLDETSDSTCNDTGSVATNMNLTNTGATIIDHS